VASAGRLIRPVAALARWFSSIRWNRGLVWIIAESALLCLLWVNVLASPNRSDPANPVGASIASPLNGAAFNHLTEVSGEMFCPSGMVGHVRISLKHIATGTTWNWKEDGWSADSWIQFDAPEGIVTPWALSVPKLAEGRYEIECRTSLDAAPPRLAARHSFLIDRTRPRVSFLPLHDQQTFFDLSELGGEIDEQAEIRFTLSYSPDFELRKYWDGSDWTGDAGDPHVNLSAASTGGFWFPAAETKLPKPNQIAPGTYLIAVSAFDRAGNEGRAAITILKPTPTLTAKSTPAN